VAVISACGGEEGAPEGVADLTLSWAGPAVVLDGTKFTVKGTGFVGPQVGELSMSFDGTCGGADLKHDAVLEYVDDGTAVWNVPPAFAQDLIARNAPFLGVLEVTRSLFGYSSDDSASLSITLTAAMNLAPSLSGVEGTSFWVGDEVKVAGTDMLTPGEGQTLLFLSGKFKVDSPPMEKEIQSVAVPLDVEERDLAVFVLSPTTLGVYPGTFTGTMRLENHVSHGVAVAPLASAELQGATFRVEPAAIYGFTPQVVRRGQKVNVSGRGFVPADPVGETATLVVLDGSFKTEDGKEMAYTGKDTMLLFPEAFTGNTGLEVVLRVTVDVEGKLQGLGLIPGMFTGTAYAEVFSGGDSHVGDGFDFTIQVGKQLQIVYVKYLPSFDDAFHDFGLYEVRDAVKQRILERCNRDYAAFNVQFVDARPEDFEEYSVIELSGEDPNGANLLGLDNTTGKDNQNIRFNDVIGGKNAETEERGYYAYGGVFLKSFLLFSQTLGGAQSTMASPRFDEIFSAFVPELGGEPVEAGEYPGGARGAAIAEAVRVLGNVVGGTVAHEIGHSLGLSMVPGSESEYHNIGDNPGWIMDAGNFRPFDERCEIDGKGPEVFEPYNIEYLSKILPKG